MLGRVGAGGDAHLAVYPVFGDEAADVLEASPARTGRLALCAGIAVDCRHDLQPR